MPTEQEIINSINGNSIGGQRIDNNIETESLDNKGEDNHSKAKEVGSFIWETAKLIIISLAIIIPIRYYLVQPFFVKGASMEMNFHDGDYLLIDEITYRFDEPRRGDVIVFRYPDDPSQFYIKRIIGLPGETIEVKNGQVKIYNSSSKTGFILDEYYLSPSQETRGNVTEILESNEYFVMGDNRLQSSDSRRWGPVSQNLITGRALIRLWPLTKIMKVEKVSYE